MARLILSFLVVLSFSSYSKLIVKTYNIRNFSSGKSTNLNLLTKTLKRTPFDLLGLQEIRNPEFFTEFIGKALPNRSLKTLFSKCGGGGRQKLGFVYNSQKLRLKKYKEDLSLTGRQPTCHRGSRPAFIALFENLEKGTHFVAINLHLKAGGCSRCVEKRFSQLKKLNTIIEGLRSEGLNNILVLGDLNTTNYNNPKSPYKKAFQNFVKNTGFKDSATQMKCTSYWSGKNREDGIEVPSLLDHILISNTFFNQHKSVKTSLGAHCRERACKASLLSEMGKVYTEVSDHCPVGLYLK